MSKITNTNLLMTHKIADGQLNLFQEKTDNPVGGRTTYFVNTVRNGIVAGRRYTKLKGAQDRFNSILAAHTPPRGYTPPPEPVRPPNWGRFG